MKQKILLTAFCTIFAFSGTALIASDGHDHSHDKAKTEVKGEVKKVELKNQTLCPVMGGEIDSTIFTDIQGQRVYHCCPMCSKKLKADPDKYFQEAAANGILFESIQTNCLVSGEELTDKEVYSDYEGRRIYFCCKKCRGSFKKDPTDVLGALGIIDVAKSADSLETKVAPKEDHSGHNH